MDMNGTMTAEAQTEVQSKAQATPEGFMITTTLTTSIMVLLSQG
jgi:hypothetical protein